MKLAFFWHASSITQLNYAQLLESFFVFGKRVSGIAVRDVFGAFMRNLVADLVRIPKIINCLKLLLTKRDQAFAHCLARKLEFFQNAIRKCVGIDDYQGGINVGSRIKARVYARPFERKRMRYRLRAYLTLRHIAKMLMSKLKRFGKHVDNPHNGERGNRTGNNFKRQDKAVYINILRK